MIRFISSFLITITISILCFVKSGISFSELLSQLQYAFYQPNYDYLSANFIYGNNMMTLIYLLILIFLPLFIIFDSLKTKIHKNASLWKIMKQKGIKTIYFLLILMTFLQIKDQINYSFNEYSFYKDLPHASRYYEINASAANLAKQCRVHLPGKLNSSFKTDLDLNADPGMFFQRALAYYLYPIDIKDIRQEPKDSLIVIKTNPQSELSNDWQLLATINDQTLIAIRKIK